MGESIKGRRVVWGVPSDPKDAAHAATSSGIVIGATFNTGGEVAEIGDEQNDIVTRIDHAAKYSGTFEIVCEPDTDLPKKGDEIEGIGTIDDIDFDAGRTFVDDSQVVYRNNDSKKITVPFSHYPDMGPDDSSP